MSTSIRPLPGPEIYARIEALGLPDDVQGWHSNHGIFAKLISETKPKVIVEVGSWKGASAIHMAKLAPDATIYCCDTWFGGIDHDINQQVSTSIIPRDMHGYPRLYHQFLSNVARAGFKNRIVPVVQTSINALRLLAAHGIKADLAYIDGTHEAECILDMDHAWNLILAPGGIMFGDDFGFPDVADAASRFAAHTGVTLEIVSQNYWLFRKPALSASEASSASE